jgi:acyl-CoA synthetase (AMP-forming)/AMP-acid ligase II
MFEERQPQIIAMSAPDDPSQSSTLNELLRRRAALQPTQTAYTFLADGEVENGQLTYAELDRRARAVANVLRSRGLEGERALLLYNPGLDFIVAFFGCLYAGVIAVPAFPSQSQRQWPRLQAIMADAQATIVLTSSLLMSTSKRRAQETPGSEPVHWLATDEIDLDPGEGGDELAVMADDLAYLQYTSGSTSAPKGVMVSHRNLLHNVAYLDYVFDHAPGSAFVTWLPHFHDMGLIYGLVEPLYKGFPCYSMPPVAFVQQPLRWLRAISNYRATHTVGPNFAYAHCVRRIKPEQCEGLDLSAWRVAINGAEPVRKETLEQFSSLFEPFGFRRSTFCPGYGLAEATLMVTGTLKASEPIYCTVEASKLGHHQVVECAPDKKNALTLTGNGHAACDTKAVIVNPESSLRCGLDEVGEVWVLGPSVTRGYWNRREETRIKFQAHLADGGEGPFLRTGDLGFLHDGELYITGRIQDLIIIAGRNYHPQDIELTTEESHAAIRPSCCAAFSLDIEGEERLVIAAEIDHAYSPQSNGHPPPDALEAAHADLAVAEGLDGEGHAGKRRTLDGEAIMRAIRHAVAVTHELQVYEILLLKAGNIPKTSSGKLRRQDCKRSFQARSLKLWTK